MSADYQAYAAKRKQRLQARIDDLLRDHDELADMNEELGGRPLPYTTLTRSRHRLESAVVYIGGDEMAKAVLALIKTLTQDGAE